MSYARSPRPVCSMTIGTSIIFASFTFTPHSCPERRQLFGGGIDSARFMRTDGIKSRGFSRCGFYFEFYPALHHVSNARESLPVFVLTALRALRFRDQCPHR